MKHISSPANPLYRQLLALQRSARERKRHGLSVIEGLHLVGAYAQRHGPPETLFVADTIAPGTGDTRLQELRRVLDACSIAPVRLGGRLLADASQLEEPGGLIAIVRTPYPKLPERIRDDAVYLDRVQDPGNVGSIIRSCAAVGIRTLLASPGTAFCWSPKVLRAGMGAHFHVDIHEGVPPALLLERLACPAFAMSSGAPEVLYDADLRQPAVWLLGSEGQGLSPELEAAAGVRRISIPQTEAVESLNVGVAAAVCLYEQVRQRRTAKGA